MPVLISLHQAREIPILAPLVDEARKQYKQALDAYVEEVTKDVFDKLYVGHLSFISSQLSSSQAEFSSFR